MSTKLEGMWYGSYLICIYYSDLSMCHAKKSFLVIYKHMYIHVAP